MKNTITHRMMTAATCAFLLMFCAYGAQAQTLPAADPNYSVGIYGGMQFSMFNGVYRELPGTQNCCPTFDEGSAAKPYFGGLFGIPIMSQLSAQIRVGAANFGLRHTAREIIGNALERDGNDYRVVDAVSEYVNVSNISVFEISPRILAYPISGFPLAIHAGASALLIGKFDVEQEENIVAPSSAVYSDTRSSLRNAMSSDVTDAETFKIAPFFGLNYDLKFGDKQQWTFAPEVGYVTPLGSFAAFSSSEPNSSYTVGGFRAGVALMYSFIPETADIPRKSDGRQQKKPLVVKVAAREMLPTGERPLAIVKVKETISTQLYPLIPYVFFDEASNEGPVRYRKYTVASRRSFDTTQLFRFDNTDNRAGVALDVYYNIMNIVGARMQRYPDATLTLSGYNNDRNAEKNNRTLSRSRAVWVRDYLRDVWQIPESRLIVADGNLPPISAKTGMADSRDSEDGYEENRRVELASSNPAVLQPLQVFDTLRTIEHPRVRFTLNVAADTAINAWSLKAAHPDLAEGKTMIVNKRGEGTPDPYIEWTSENTQRTVPKSEEPIAVNFNVVDYANNEAGAVATLPVEINTIAKRRKNMEGDVEVNTYRIVGFDYESSGSSSTVQTIVDRFLKPDVVNADIVEIRGYTDRKGDAAANLRLAEQRATTIGNIIQPMTKARVSAPKGMGEDQAQFANTLPEQRLYNRMVEVVVRKNSK